MTATRSVLVAVFGVLGGVLCPGPVCAQETPLDRYIRTGLEANLRLERQELALEQAEAGWAESRSNYLPSIEFQARYSMARGGRTFDVPVGDLLNDAYATLNGLTGTQQFPAIQNQKFDLLRDREQETRVRVTQVLWNPAVGAGARSGRFRADATRAETEAVRRALVRDIRVAYYTFANALRAEAILDDALELVLENERSSNALVRTALATNEQVHRARAERLEVEAQRDRAETDRLLAASYFNYLLARDPAADIEVSPTDLTLPDTGPIGRLREAATSQSDDAWIRTLAEGVGTMRPELDQLDQAVAAAEAGLGAARASTLPTVALAVDAGLQGREYGFGADNRYLMASVVLSWAVTNGGGERSRIRQARLERDMLERERADAEARIRLELQTAAYNTRVALRSIETATERLAEAERAFTLVRRRREEGLATPLEFFDARAAFTRARQSHSIAEAEALIRLAELDYATGGAPDDLAGEGAPGQENER